MYSCGWELGLASCACIESSRHSHAASHAALAEFLSLGAHQRQVPTNQTARQRSSQREPASQPAGRHFAPTCRMRVSSRTEVPPTQAWHLTDR